MENYEYKSLKLNPDYEGNVKATLISSKRNVGNRQAVLYIHGFIDYFFHDHLADEFINREFDFYALELRKYGHSLEEHQHPNYCRSIEEYFEEITIAIDEIYASSSQEIILLGHSTGGLISTLYKQKGERRDKISKLILNSPFFEFNSPLLVKKLAPKVARIICNGAPYANVKGVVSEIYPKSLHKEHGGEWDFDTKYKPIEGYPAYLAWINAINRAQQEIIRNCITAPVLVMYSASSFIAKEGDDVSKSDIVLNVSDIKRVGKRVGDSVTLCEIKDAKHDVFLSEKAVREAAFKEMFLWLKAK